MHRCAYRDHVILLFSFFCYVWSPWRVVPFTFIFLFEFGFFGISSPFHAFTIVLMIFILFYSGDLDALLVNMEYEKKMKKSWIHSFIERQGYKQQHRKWVLDLFSCWSLALACCSLTKKKQWSKMQDVILLYAFGEQCNNKRNHKRIREEK